MEIAKVQKMEIQMNLSETPDKFANRLEHVDKSHTENLFSQLSCLQKRGQFCDASLIIEEHEVRIHCAVLASASSYFFDLFMRQTEEGSNSSTFKLKDVRWETFKFLLDFIYTGRLSVPDDEVKEVYHVSKRLRIPAATKACGQYLISGLTPDTCLATTVGGGYINGTAESIGSSGLIWTQAPFGIFIGLSLGGLIFAKPMREKCYMTMLDPLYEQYGSILVVLVYCASLCGDLFWTASILLALGTSLSVILNIGLTLAIICSASVTVFYTMIGLMVSVAYTDVVQLCLITFGLVFSVPFILTNENVGSIDPVSTDWTGQLDTQYIGQWVDLAIVMTFGTIPWQAYFQRVLSVRSSKQAQVLSVVGGALSLILVIPSVLIGAAAKNAAWNTTGYGSSPLNSTDASMTLPLVLHEFSPRPVAVIALGSISAAVMSSMDSAVLASSSMFTCNIYKQILRQKASQRELLWIQRFAVFIVGAMATVISIFVPVIYGLFILAADVVFVIVLPQLTCSLFFKSTNTYGAVIGYMVGLLFRVGAGEPYLNIPPLIKYPLYTGSTGQVFPFRTFSMSLSFFCIIAVSLLMKYLFSKHILSKSFDVFNVFNDCSQQRRLSTQEHSYCAPVDQFKCLSRKTSTTPNEHGDGEISENCV